MIKKRGGILKLGFSLCLAGIALAVVAASLPAAYGAERSNGSVTAAAGVTIKVVMDDNYPPYSFRGEDGILKGIVVDQWRLWERKTGGRAILQGRDWLEAQRSMEAREFDVIDTIFRNEKRDLIYDFSKPYADIPVPLFIHTDIRGIRGVKDLKGFMVAAKAGGNVIEVLKREGVTNIVEYPSYEKIVEAARDGQVKVFTVDRPPAMYYLNKMGIQDRFRETPPMYHGLFHRAVHRGERRLLARVEDGFSRISKEEYDEIDRRWQGSAIAGGGVWRYLMITVGSAAALCLALALWLAVLRRLVAQRTVQLQREIDARIAQEGLLRESELRFRSIFDASNEAIFVHEIPSGRIVDVNQTSCEMFGYSHDRMVELSLDEVGSGVPPYTQAEALAFIEGAAAGIRQLFEWQARKSDGSLFWIEVQMRRIAVGSVDRVVVTARDITRRKKVEEERAQLQEQLLQACKMESIGRLAGGVAHDFNNMLTVILGLAGLCMRKMPAEDPNYKCFDLIYQAASRSTDITKQLLAFSRKEAVAPREVDLNARVKESQKILARLISEAITITFTPCSDLWSVRIDPSQVDQILMNLAANANDAMPDGGELALETAKVHLDFAGSFPCEEAVPGDYVLLTVRDTGCGMDRDTMQHVFEPFFTTKEVGAGTGLGLATVYGIVAQNGGFIDLASEPGRGTVFKIYLPRYEHEAEAVEEIEALRTRGAGTILVVEDEEMLLRTATHLLEEIGYSVIKADNPFTALAICEDPGIRIDMVLTDVVMPGMNGKEMSQRMKLTRPGLKTLFMSGYPAKVVESSGIVEQGMYYIKKPLDFQELRVKITQAMA